jgi:hypothetical protein
MFELGTRAVGRLAELADNRLSSLIEALLRGCQECRPEHRPDLRGSIRQAVSDARAAGLSFEQDIVRYAYFAILLSPTATVAPIRPFEQLQVPACSDNLVLLERQLVYHLHPVEA